MVEKSSRKISFRDPARAARPLAPAKSPSRVGSDGMPIAPVLDEIAGIANVAWQIAHRMRSISMAARNRL
jgi:hypothetical protein